MIQRQFPRRAEEDLRCPDTGEGLRLHELRGAESGVTHGILSSSKRDYPLVFGVALFGDPNEGLYLDALRAGAFDGLRRLVLERTEAIPALVDEEQVPLFDLGANVLEHVRAGAESDFDLGGTREWLLQLAYWHATKKASSLSSFLPQIAELRVSRVLDLGAGVGHAAWTAARVTGASDATLLDRDFAQLLAAPWVLDGVPMALVACDLERTLPLQSDRFDLVISGDALHYLREKAGLFVEIDRVRTSRGTFFAWHLHVQGQSDHHGEHAMSAEGWAALGSRVQARIEALPASDESPPARTVALYSGQVHREQDSTDWFARPAESDECVHPGYRLDASVVHPVEIPTSRPDEYVERRAHELSSTSLAELRSTGVVVPVSPWLYGKAATRLPAEFYDSR